MTRGVFCFCKQQARMTIAFPTTAKMLRASVKLYIIVQRAERSTSSVLYLQTLVVPFNKDTVLLRIMLCNVCANQLAVMVVTSDNECFDT